MVLALTIIHVVICLALVVVVLMQHGKQQGLSGAIAGGAETFFGKNKGRTVDAMLKKFTAVVAILFIISSVALTFVAVQNAAPAESTGTTDSATQDLGNVTADENGNLVDANGNIIGSTAGGNEGDAGAADEGNADAGTVNTGDANAAVGGVDDSGVVVGGEDGNVPDAGNDANTADGAGSAE